MESVMVSELSRLIRPSSNRYESPRQAVMQLRRLWIGRKIPEAEADSKDAQELYKIITEKLEKGTELSSIFHLITKGLMLNPKLHFFYSMKGDYHSQKDNWTQAIKSYEQARIFSKGRPVQESIYKNNLIDIYFKRGTDYEKKEELLKALGDFEQILVLKPQESIKFIVQDKILSILKSMDRYIAYRFHWTEFIKAADPKRTSNLLTQHAEYKIYLREMSVARYILFDAIELDKTNTKAQDLLQSIFFIGHSMVAHAIIWCAYGCYDKALLTIEKGRDCAPYNPGYTLLKAIVLRLSGRLAEAAKWLKSVDKGFYKLLEPSKDTHGSLMGNFTIEETKLQLIQQWHLIRYDLAVALMTQDRYEDAISVLNNKNLLEMFAETHTLLGDCYQNLQMPIVALESYIKSFEKHQELKTLAPKSKKRLHLMQRLATMITSDIFKFSKLEEISNLTKKVLKIFSKENIDLNRIVCQQ